VGVFSCAEEEETINIKQKAGAKKSFMLFRVQNADVTCRIMRDGYNGTIDFEDQGKQ
jgi:hypothetical protein